MEDKVPLLENRMDEEPNLTELSLSDSSGESKDADAAAVAEEKKCDDALNLSPRRMSAPQSQASASHFAGLVIGPTNLYDLVSCPCCHQCFDDTQMGTLNEPVCTGRHLSPYAARNRSLVTEESDDDDDIEDDDDVLPGVLAEGVRYSPKRILVEGWLHKKGTGKDWLGSRAWKPRWARLILARVDGFDIDVPLLLIYWFPASATVSTAIVLDSTVVMPVDTEDKGRWNSFRFEIRHIPKHEYNKQPLATRMFTAPRKGRDAWVYAISQALLSYEKEKDKARKTATMQMIESVSPRRSKSPDRVISPSYDDVWTGGDNFGNAEQKKLSPSSPPPALRTRSPMQHTGSPPLPRPQPRRPSARSETAKPAGLLMQPSL